METRLKAYKYSLRYATAFQGLSDFLGIHMTRKGGKVRGGWRRKRGVGKREGGRKRRKNRQKDGVEPEGRSLFSKCYQLDFYQKNAPEGKPDEGGQLVRGELSEISTERKWLPSIHRELLPGGSRGFLRPVSVRGCQGLRTRTSLQASGSHRISLDSNEDSCYRKLDLATSDKEAFIWRLEVRLLGGNAF